eukprot:3691785-Amphidinium_carterae.1
MPSPCSQGAPPMDLPCSKNNGARSSTSCSSSCSPVAQVKNNACTHPSAHSLLLTVLRSCDEPLPLTLLRIRTGVQSEENCTRHACPAVVRKFFLALAI